MVLPILPLSSVFFAGLLAGEEATICFGVRAPVRLLEKPASIEVRQHLIRRLRIIVPLIYAAAVLTGTASTLVQWALPGSSARVASLVLLALFMTLTLLGTVPINKAAISWDVENPPSDWQAMIRRWEVFDNFRTALAIVAFGLALAGL